MRCHALLLVGSLLLAGCFADPDRADEAAADDDDGGSTAASGVTTPGASSTTSSTSQGESTSDDPAASADASSGQSTATIGGTSSTSDDDSETTTEVEPNVLAELYDVSCEMVWESASAFDELMPAACDRGPQQENIDGGARLLPMFLSPDLGEQSNVLIIEPFPDTDGFTQGSLLLGPAIMNANAPQLRAEVEAVNLMGSGVGVDLTLQVRLFKPDSPPMTLVDEFLLEGDRLSIDVPLENLGPGDELSFVLLGSRYSAEEGIALYQAEIVDLG